MQKSINKKIKMESRCIAGNIENRPKVGCKESKNYTLLVENKDWKLSTTKT